jgi:pimeloyl-ACP methyl ester carboxylesterase
MPRFDHRSGQHLRIGAAEIYVEVTGNPAGEPLVLLHGGLGSMVDLNAVLERLPPDFRLIGIDLRGHGKSTMGSESLGYPQHQSDVETVLKRLEISAFALFGFSDGGIVACRMAAEASSGVRQLITLGAPWRLLADDPSLPILKGVTSRSWREKFPDSVAYYEKINPQPDFDALVEAAVPGWIDPHGYPNETVRQIKCPTFIIRGDDDFLYSLGEAAELRGRIDGAAFLNIPFAAHAAHEESPEILGVAVNRFLARTISEGEGRPQ